MKTILSVVFAVLTITIKIAFVETVLAAITAITMSAVTSTVKVFVISAFALEAMAISDCYFNLIYLQCDYWTNPVFIR